MLKLFIAYCFLLAGFGTAILFFALLFGNALNPDFLLCLGLSSLVTIFLGSLILRKS
jgi:hypothetical protein